LLCRDASDPDSFFEPIGAEHPDDLVRISDADDCIDIGLLNNMPDLALRSTETQFIGLLAAAAGERVIRLHFFSLPEIARGDAARSHMQTLYGDLDDMRSRRLDALIVTGNEPRAPRLSDEPYWNSLVEIIDWAEHNTVSTVWSCLAAHAAVLHLDGVIRHPLAAKRCGVFECVKASEHPLLDGVRMPLRISHSRWNDLREADLSAHGYRVLTRSAQAGVDIFVKPWRSLFVFFQGHPEYEPRTLLREYRRDVARYLRGEAAVYPSIPVSYFDRLSEAAVAAFAERARAAAGPDLMAQFPAELSPAAGLEAMRREASVAIIRNWLSYIASSLTGR
jgi:homoserine O-succinyltransferase